MVFNRRRPILKLDASGKSPAYVDDRRNQPASRKVAGFSFGGFDRRRFSTAAAVRFSRLDASGKSPAYIHRRRISPQAERLRAFHLAV
jgi:hypothetical protein